MVEVVRRTAEEVFIPFTIGGGLRSIEDIRRMLRAGRIKYPEHGCCPESGLDSGRRFGFWKPCIVVAIDARNVGENRWEVYIHEEGHRPELMFWSGRKKFRNSGQERSS
jgi:cyclase